MKIIRSKIFKEEELEEMCDEMDQIELLEYILSRGGFSLYIVIHNLDELMRKNANVWNFISLHLAVPPAQVHMIISLDHYLSAILLNPSLPFLWIECSSLLPYDLELSFEDDLHLANPTLKIGKRLKLLDPFLLQQATIRTLQALSSTSKLLFLIIASLLLAAATSSEKALDFDFLFSKANSCSIFVNDRSGFEITLKHLQSYDIIFLDLKHRKIKTTLHKQILEKILIEYEDFWIEFASELQI